MSSGTVPELQIDRAYYNTLDVESFALMLKDPSYCYKLYWLEALVGLFSEGKTKARQKFNLVVFTTTVSDYLGLPAFSAGSFIIGSSHAESDVASFTERRT